MLGSPGDTVYFYFYIHDYLKGIVSLASAIMELRHLRYFVAVAEEQSFRRAALRLHISQPPLTRQIQQLESEVGFTLFERHAAGASLTTAGACFLEDARQILRQAGTSVEKARSLAEGRSGRLETAFYGSIIFHILPAILARFRVLAPGVSVGISHLHKDAQIRALHEGWLDIGFARFYREESNLTSELVCSEPLILAVASEHPLANEKQVRLADLEPFPFIVFPQSPRPSFADEVIRLATEAGFSITIAQEAEDLVGCLALVSVNFGIALVPASAQCVGMRNLKFIPVEQPVPVSNALCITRENDINPLLGIFLETMRQVHRR